MYDKTDIGPFAIVPLWIAESVSPNALKVWTIMWATWASRDDDSCWPSIETIAEAVGKSKTVTRESVRELESAGALVRQEQFNDRGQTTNLYKMVVTKPLPPPEIRTPPLRKSGPHPSGIPVAEPKSFEPKPMNHTKDYSGVSPHESIMTEEEPIVSSSPLPTIIGSPDPAIIGGNAGSLPATDTIRSQLSLLNIDGEPKRTKAPKYEEEANAVFDMWVEMFGHPRARRTPKRLNRIRARLKEGFTVEELVSAMRGTKGSAWHMGENDTGTVYDAIDNIFLSADRVEALMKRDPKAKKQEEDEMWDRLLSEAREKDRLKAERKLG